MSEFIVKELTEEHLQAVLDIYNYYVRNTVLTFHIHALSLDEMREIVFFKNDRYKSFVIYFKGRVCGYVILHQFRVREAYDESAEISIYLESSFIGQGLGSLAIKYIEDVAREKNFRVLVATICGKNERSLNAFQKGGYVKCAHFREVGKKFGQILDSISYQKILE